MKDSTHLSLAVLSYGKAAEVLSLGAYVEVALLRHKETQVLTNYEIDCMTATQCVSSHRDRR